MNAKKILVVGVLLGMIFVGILWGAARRDNSSVTQLDLANGKVEFMSALCPYAGELNEYWDTLWMQEKALRGAGAGMVDLGSDLRNKCQRLDELATNINYGEVRQRVETLLQGSNFALFDGKKKRLTVGLDLCKKLFDLVVMQQKSFIKQVIEKLKKPVGVAVGISRVFRPGFTQNMFEGAKIELGKQSIGKPDSMQTAGKNTISFIRISGDIVAVQLPVTKQTGASCGSNAWVNAGFLRETGTPDEVIAMLKSGAHDKAVQKNVSDLALLRKERESFPVGGASIELATFNPHDNPRRKLKGGEWMLMEEMQYFNGLSINSKELETRTCSDGIKICRTVAAWTSSQSPQHTLVGSEHLVDILITFLQGNPEVFMFLINDSHWITFRVEALCEGKVAFVVVDSLNEPRIFDASFQTDILLPLADFFLNPERVAKETVVALISRELEAAYAFQEHEKKR